MLVQRNFMVTCPKCKGKGKFFDHEIGMFTLGIGYVWQLIDDGLKINCPMCKGNGYIDIDKFYENNTTL